MSVLSTPLQIKCYLFGLQLSVEEHGYSLKKHCMSNKIRQVHFKILHNVYLANSQISTFVNLSNICVFCKVEEETRNFIAIRLNLRNLICHLSPFIKCDLNFSFKDTYLYFSKRLCYYSCYFICVAL